MRDAAVQESVDDLFRHHRKLRELNCDVAIKGGVAHVHGLLADAAECDLVRRALARLRGVDAVWDTLNVRGNGELNVIDIGCGGSKQVTHAIGVDAHPHPGVDLVTDMENGLPFDDNRIDYVFAVHFLEHIRNLVGLMNEIHRVLKPGGVLHAMVPHQRHANASADPTHVRYFNTRTFRYFCERRPGVLRWQPLCASDTGDNVLADLQPVQADHSATVRDLDLFFD